MGASRPLSVNQEELPPPVGALARPSGWEGTTCPKPEARGGGWEELPHAPKPKAKGGGQEEQPHARGQGRWPGRTNPTSKELWLRGHRRA